MPQISVLRHPALGRLIRLEGVAAAPLSLTPQEAATIARALSAVREGRSSEREIYLSPIASDASFQALVEAEGLRCGERFLHWAMAERLAAQLLEAAGD